MHNAIPEQVANAILALKEKGVDSWVIGGAVRDTLLGRPVHDWDLTAAGTPEQILAALPAAKPIGGEFGTVTWHGIEITPCRAESDYTDHRHPDTITFGTDLRVDLSRRDFTVNAMAWDGTLVIDPYHGRDDLQAGVLRAVGAPEVRFEEDALRILRLYRFAGALGFAVEAQTGKQALARAETLQLVSVPRVRGEIEKALQGKAPSALAPLIAVGGLEPFGVDGEALRQTPNALAALDLVPENRLCRWWALLHLTQSNAIRAAKIFDFGKTFQRDFVKLNELFAQGMPKGRHALKQVLSVGLPFSVSDMVETFAVIDERFAPLPQMYRDLLASGEPYLKEHLQITPAALVGVGLKGKAVGDMQRCLLQAVMDTPAYNTKEMLAELIMQLKPLL